MFKVGDKVKIIDLDVVPGLRRHEVIHVLNQVGATENTIFTIVKVDKRDKPGVTQAIRLSYLDRQVNYTAYDNHIALYNNVLEEAVEL